VLTLIVMPLSEWSGAAPCAKCPALGIDPDVGHLIWDVLTLHITYYLVDIPLLYVRLLLLAPLALALLVKGHTRVLLGLSWAAWLVYQLDPRNSLLDWNISNNGTFGLAGWQVFFFTAMVLGYHSGRTRTTQSFARLDRNLFIAAVGTLGLVLLFFGLHGMFGREIKLDSLNGTVVDELFGKAGVRPGRVLASIILFTFLYLVTLRWWPTISRLSGWLLLPLGRNPLYAYTTHVLVGVVFASIGVPRAIVADGTWSENLALQLLAIGVVYGVVRSRAQIATLSNAVSAAGWRTASATARAIWRSRAEPAPSAD